MAVTPSSIAFVVTDGRLNARSGCEHTRSAEDRTVGLRSTAQGALTMTSSATGLSRLTVALAKWGGVTPDCTADATSTITIQ